jgi:uncharacterized protein
VSVAAFIVLSLVIMLASCLQGSIGFGIGLVAAPVVTLIDPSLLPGMLIMLAFVLCLVVAVKERASINLHGTGWALLGRVPGTVAGGYLVSVLPDRWLALLLGVVVLSGALMAGVGWQPVPTRPGMAVAGAASGLLGTATSIGGPPMALIWSSSSGPRLRGTMAAFFLVGSLLSMAVLVLAGEVTRHTLDVTLWFLPAVAVGYGLSRYVNQFLSRPRLRATALATSVAGAVLLIANQLF